MQTQSFGYDALNRLTSAQATGGTNGLYNEAYGYNASTGNLSSKAGNNYSYGSSAHPHAATQQGTGNFYAYDSNGNMTTRTIGASTYALGYDAEGRMTSVGSAATASFVYDGDSQRVKSTINGTTIAYIGAHAEWNVIDQKMTRYYLYGSERIAMKTIQSGQRDLLTYVLADHLGSASVTTDASGVKQSELRYRAWGETRYTSGSTSTAYQYTGQRNDPGLGGLMFYNARWYDPSLNRFAQADTLIPGAGNALAWDRYAYSLNSPVVYNDPSGHFSNAGGAQQGIFDESEIGNDLGYERMIYPLSYEKLAIESFLTDIAPPLKNRYQEYINFGDNRGINPKDRFHNDEDRFHISVDAICSPKTRVYPIYNGKVVYTGTTDLGDTIIVDHNINGVHLYSVYGHLGDPEETYESFTVKKGDVVTTDTIIGLSGNTKGKTRNEKTPYHLHFEVRTSRNLNVTASDPLQNYRFWGYKSEGGYENNFVNLGRVFGYSGDYPWKK